MLKENGNIPRNIFCCSTLKVYNNPSLSVLLKGRSQGSFSCCARKKKYLNHAVIEGIFIISVVACDTEP